MTEHTSKDPIKAIKALLTDELHIDAVHFPVDVKSENGSIIIEGTVEKISQKKRAMLYAMGLAGITGIIDRLRVRPSSHMSDAQIRDHLYGAFAGESAFKGLKLEAEVTGGIVDLEGEVWSLSHKRLAGVLAWWIPGVLDVINSIEVNPPEEDSDGELSDAVRLALEKDRLVDAQSLKVSTNGYVVTLEGVTGCAAEREAAEDDAWFTWGVNDVVNNIVVDEASVHKLP